MEPHRIILINKISELNKLHKTVNSLCATQNISEGICMSINLVLEEAFTNIVNYAYNDKNDHQIEIEFNFSNNSINIVIIDDGKYYDPTGKPDPDITLSADERPIGGLGIFMMKKIMDGISYERINNQNRLYLTKKITT